MQPSLCVAHLVKPHGIQGEVILRPLVEDLHLLSLPLQSEKGAFHLKKIRQGPHGLIASFEEIPDRTTAEKICPLDLLLSRDQLPLPSPEEVYWVDLIGLPLLSPTGEKVGTLQKIEDFGAGEIVTIEKKDGTDVLLPLHSDFILLPNDPKPDHLTLTPDGLREFHAPEESQDLET